MKRAFLTAALIDFLLISSFASAQAVVTDATTSVVPINNEITKPKQVLTASWTDVNGVKRTVITKVSDIASAIDVHRIRIVRAKKKWPPRA